jgi:hypothetical protein
VVVIGCHVYMMRSGRIEKLAGHDMEYLLLPRKLIGSDTSCRRSRFDHNTPWPCAVHVYWWLRLSPLGKMRLIVNTNKVEHYIRLKMVDSKCTESTNLSHLEEMKIEFLTNTLINSQRDIICLVFFVLCFFKCCIGRIP